MADNNNNTRRRGFSPLLAFFLGLLFGIIILIGAVAGAVIFALNYKLDNIAQNKDGDGNYIYVNADPESGGVSNVLELVKKVTELAGDSSSLTLGQVEQLLPVTNKLTDGLYNALEQYIEVDREEVKAVRFSALGDYFKDKVMEVEVVNLLQQFGGGLPDNEIINMLLYDEEDNPVTLRQLADGDFLDALNEKKVKDLIGESNEITDKILGDLTVGELLDGSADFEKIVNEMEICTFVDVEPSDAIMAFLAFSVTDVQQTEGDYSYKGVYHPADGEAEECFIQTENGKIKDVFTADGSQTHKTNLSDVSKQVARLTSTLKIKDIITIDESNKLLSAVSDSTIEELPSYIENMAINELYADNIYGDSADHANPEPAKMYRAVRTVTNPDEEKEYNPAYLYYVEEDGKYKLVNATSGNAGKITEEEFEDGIYYTYGEPNAMWKLLLYSNGSEKAFSVNKITDMITNVTANTRNTTMRELHEAGLMTFDKPEELDIKINYNGKQTIGDLTLSELVGFFVSIAQNPAFGTLFGSGS